MSVNPESSGIVAFPARIQEVQDVSPQVAAPAEPAATREPALPEEPPAAAVAAPALYSVPAPVRSRPRWLVSAAVAAVGLIASGALGYFLYATTGQRDAARHQLASTQATLATTKDELSAAKSDAAAKKTTADYVTLFVANNGAVQTDYENIVACNAYSDCRTAAQQLLTDLEAFQQARSSAQVPAALSTSDATLGDALSAAIAGTQEFISGMDNNDTAKIKDGGSKVDAAMLNMAKAEATLGTELR
jgi:hypothetical protein